MKFGLFFVMQRPEGCSERQIYETELPQMVAADQLGYHSIWVAEHHFSDYGVCSAPQVLTAAVAGQTRRLRIGMGITLLPLHDPVQIAEELAVLDLLSGGRLEVGIGRASSTVEYAGYAVPYEESRARVDEGLEMLRGLWTRDHFSYAGTFRTVRDLSLVPKPLQQPHPPLYLACNSADSVPIAARHGLAMMSSWLVLDQALVERREVYRRVAAEYGHPTETIEARLAETWNIRFVYVAEDERAALAEPREHLMAFQAAAAARRRAAGGADHPLPSYEEYLNSGLALFGTPAQLVEKIGRLRERTGLRNLLCHLSVRAMDPARASRAMELFATKVLPHFRD